MKYPKFKVGKERITEHTNPQKCPKCNGKLYEKNGANSSPGFCKGAINYWVCDSCNREFEVIEDWGDSK